MAVIRSEIRIERPREVVFDVVSDPRSELDWNPKVRVMEKLTEGEIGPGSRFRAKWTKSPVVNWRFFDSIVPRAGHLATAALSLCTSISLSSRWTTGVPPSCGAASMLRPMVHFD